MSSGVSRAWFVALESQLSCNIVITVNRLTVLSCVLPVWLVICNLRLWLPADEAALEKIEQQIYRKHVLTDHKMTKVAGLGTVHVPYCGALGDNSHLPPRKLVLVHGYGAGNAFWATVSVACAPAAVVGVVETENLMFRVILWRRRTCKRSRGSSMWWANTV